MRFRKQGGFKPDTLHFFMHKKMHLLDFERLSLGASFSKYNYFHMESFRIWAFQNTSFSLSRQKVRGYPPRGVWLGRNSENFIFCIWKIQKYFQKKMIFKNRNVENENLNNLVTTLSNFLSANRSMWNCIWDSRIKYNTLK